MHARNSHHGPAEKIAARICKRAKNNVFASKARRQILRVFKRDGCARWESVAILSLATYVVLTALSLGFGSRSMDAVWSWKRVLAVCVIVYSIEVVDFLRIRFLDVTVKDLVENVKDGAENYEKWLDSLFSGRERNIAGVLAFASVPTVLPLLQQSSYGDRFVGIVVGYVDAFALLQGGYYAVCVPWLAYKVARTQMEMYSLNPADTPWVRRISQMFGAMVAGQIVAAGLALGTIYSASEFHKASEAWLLLAVLVIAYSFLFPQFCLWWAIRRRKVEEMKQFQDRLEHGFVWLGQRTTLGDVASAYSILVNARETPLDLRSVATVLGSILIPIISLVATNWHSFHALFR